MPRRDRRRRASRSSCHPCTRKPARLDQCRVTPATPVPLGDLTLLVGKIAQSFDDSLEKNLVDTFFHRDWTDLSIGALTNKTARHIRCDMDDVGVGHMRCSRLRLVNIPGAIMSTRTLIAAGLLAALTTPRDRESGG